LNSEDCVNSIEKQIKNLDESTGASFKFKLLNKNGSIWTLVAGGGASVLYTDAIVNSGYKEQLGNYGEYSGNPSRAYVFKYVDMVLQTILSSNTKEQIYLFVGGGISNFTDVYKTFEGILDGIQKYANKIKKRNIKIFVRRGGLNYKKALTVFQQICEDLDIYCQCFGPEIHITKYIKDILPKKDCALDNITSEELPIDIKTNVIGTVNNLNIKQIYSENSKIVIYNYKLDVVQRILDYDYICNNEPSIVGIVHPQKGGTKVPVFFGKKEILIPIFTNLESAIKVNSNINVVINYFSFRSAFKTSLDAICCPNISTVIVVAEGMAERDARVLKYEANRLNKTVIGPATVGSILINKLRLGNTCGSIDNITSLNLIEQGAVSLVTRSGGLLNEMCNILSITNGIKEAVSIGGDKFPSSTFLDHIIRFQNDDDVKLICMLGEIGGTAELEVAEAVREKIITKPVVAWTMGTSSSLFEHNIQFGHAGSSVNEFYETAQFKNHYMKKCGISVPNSFEDIQELINLKIHELNIKKSEHSKSKNIKQLPFDYASLYRDNMIRKHSEFFSSISNETKSTLEYNSVPVTDIVKDEFNIGKTIGHLLFKKDIPNYLAQFIQLIITLLADHGIAVSSAHNTAVCTRSGQNISASVASGLLCIHDKHGGAIQDAATTFYEAKYINKYSPNKFVQIMKQNNQYIPGIGHRYKNSTTRKDKRVELLINFIEHNFPYYELVKYAKKVEAITLKKKENLILNVDGVVATALISAFKHHYFDEGVKELLRLNCLNSLFIISRTIGLCATYADQKRLQQDMYRHPLSGISYIE